MEQFHVLKKEGRKLVYGVGWYTTYEDALKNTPQNSGSIYKIKVVKK